MDNNDINRGDVVWYLPLRYGMSQGKYRPGVVVSCDKFNVGSSDVTVVPMTTQEKKHYPTHVNLCVGDVEGTACCENIETIDKRQIGDRIASLTTEEMQQIEIGIMTHLSVPRIVGYVI